MIGKLVKFKVPTLHGQAIVAGTVKHVLPDGRMEVKAQQGGYYTLQPSDIFYNHDANKSLCGLAKMGEYNMLHCCRAVGHDGEHNYVVDHRV